MATMGRRKVMPPELPDVSPGQNGLLAVNLIVSPFLIEPVATLSFEPPAFGGPIMREDFVTDTGFLIGSPENLH
jgi:hypothetical protein